VAYTGAGMNRAGSSSAGGLLFSWYVQLVIHFRAAAPKWVW
jgi:hypothetical protein